RTRPSTVVVITPPVVAPLVAGLWCRWRRRPLVVDCHTGTFHSRRWAWAQPIYRRLLPRCRAVLAHTDEALELIRYWGAPGLLVPDDLPTPADASPSRAVSVADQTPSGAFGATSPQQGGRVLIAGSLDENEPVSEALVAAGLLAGV